MSLFRRLTGMDASIEARQIEREAADEARAPAIKRVWQEPKGILGQLSTVQSDPNGKRQINVAAILLLIGIFDGGLMRIQLALPDNSFLEPQTFDQTFTMHGSVLMYLFATVFLEGIATLVMPLMIGARDVAWPRLTAFVFWTFLIGSVLFEGSWLLH